MSKFDASHMKSGDELTHLDEQGKAKMVAIDEKPDTTRSATVVGFIKMLPATLGLIRSAQAKKGDVIAVARVAGIMAAKKTPELIPLCHPIMLSSVEIEFNEHDGPEQTGIEVVCTAKSVGKTGVEMEALVAANTALMTIYDMCKAVDRGMIISDVKLMHKDGGASGLYRREEN